jgi:hypothetical protein
MAGRAPSRRPAHGPAFGADPTSEWITPVEVHVPGLSDADSDWRILPWDKAVETLRVRNQ